MKKSNCEAWNNFRRTELFKGKTAEGIPLEILEEQIAGVLNRYLSDPSVITVVDYGSGDGCWTEYVARKYPFKHVWGYEWNPKIIQLARTRCKGLENVNFMRVDISERWHFQADLFFAIGVMEHFEDHKKVLTNLVSTLRKNGFCILTAPNVTDISYVTKRTGLSPSEVKGKDRIIGTKYGYEEYWTPQYFKKFVEEAGLTVIELWTVDRWQTHGLVCVAQKKSFSLLHKLLGKK